MSPLSYYFSPSFHPSITKSKGNFRKKMISKLLFRKKKKWTVVCSVVNVWLIAVLRFGWHLPSHRSPSSSSFRTPILSILKVFYAKGSEIDRLKSSHCHLSNLRVFGKPRGTTYSTFTESLPATLYRFTELNIISCWKLQSCVLTNKRPHNSTPTKPTPVLGSSMVTISHPGRHIRYFMLSAFSPIAE